MSATLSGGPLSRICQATCIERGMNDPASLLFLRYEILTPNSIPKGFMDGKQACVLMVSGAPSAWKDLWLVRATWPVPVSWGEGE